MLFSDNLFNCVDMLRFEHINAIAEEDFTLDELKAFELFLFRIGTAYGAKLREEHERFNRLVKSYVDICTDIELDTLVESEFIDDIFLGLKLEVEEMAGSLVFDQAPWFFSEARRSIE